MLSNKPKRQMTEDAVIEAIRRGEGTLHDVPVRLRTRAVVLTAAKYDEALRLTDVPDGMLDEEIVSLHIKLNPKHMFSVPSELVSDETLLEIASNTRHIPLKELMLFLSMNDRFELVEPVLRAALTSVRSGLVDGCPPEFTLGTGCVEQFPIRVLRHMLNLPQTPSAPETKSEDADDSAHA